MPDLRDGLTNVDILNAIRSDARLDYQERIPEATKANIQETMSEIMHEDTTRNAFMNALVNRIGSIIIRDMVWKNPLAVFKQGMLNFGDTIEEVHLDMVKPTVYDANRDYLEKDIFGQKRVKSYSAFHKINRREKYEITINEAELRRAFLSDTGLSQFVSSMMSVMSTSDNWDEFLEMCSLFRTYEEKFGFYHMQIPDLNVFEAAKEKTDAAIKALQVAANKMTYPTRAYNSQGVPSFAKPQDLVIIATPEFQANVNVTSLAAAFHQENTSLPSHVITVPNESLQLDGVSAILTTKDFLLIKDVLLENRSIENPAGLYSNYFLHHWSILSVSSFVPAIAFGTKETGRITVPEVKNAEIQGIKVAKNDGTHNVTPKPGELRALSIDWKTPLAEGVHPAIDWDISGQKSKKTQVWNNGTLVVGEDEVKGTEITVTVTVDNPAANGQKPLSFSTTITVS